MRARRAASKPRAAGEARASGVIMRRFWPRSVSSGIAGTGRLFWLLHRVGLARIRGENAAVEQRRSCLERSAAIGEQSGDVTSPSRPTRDRASERILAGIGLVIVALACFSTLDTATKLSTASVPILMALWFR